MRSAFVGSDSTVNIVKIVSLSSCRKTEVKKLINVSYLNNGKSPVFRISQHLYMCIVVLWLYNILASLHNTVFWIVALWLYNILASLHNTVFWIVALWLYNILASLHNTVFWIVSIRTPISSYSRPLSNCINYNCYQHHPQLFKISGKIQVFVHRFAFYDFSCDLLRQQNPPDGNFLSLINTRFGFLNGISWTVSISESQRI